ncbi:MAG TPA: IclR family transcriptional regulator C-terminal domain-containing protein [Ottowia sp.]|nr:helix-turn-helix domain-containing protein [Burkholderiales bacterium]TXI22027.1 MAG: IclR family transcriptional regulator [Ottowia sp.]HOZ93066.1 IclR family transcriptional regulator C-terminal domain-containing protein [Ottowia sp.]HQO52110.1 IclR family transcriptional regulator C-terminal domain-containing protein [Ottowia sp.]HQQ52245.1 IclR family transcriptional regulator C-terminal domain-containing protein [Ottowia sp.]
MHLAPADTIAGLVKGLAVLESFDTERQRLNATQAAQRAGLTRAAARRHLLTLAHVGYLESDGQFFWLSPRALRLAGAYLASARLPRVVQPALNRLAAATQDVYSAVVLDGDEVVIIARSAGLGAPGTRLLAYGMHLGARLPAHTTSTGRVLLAALPRPALTDWLAHHQALPRLTPHTTTGTRAFKALLAQVARQDWALSSEENELGVHALAVPLRNAQGATVAALNVIVPPARFSDALMQQELLPRLREAARELRQML